MGSAKQVAATLADIDAVRARLLREQKAETEREVRAVRSIPVACSTCKRTSVLHRWTFVQHRSYTPPSGCTEGDYWSDDGVQFCHIACPNCGTRSYIYNRHDRDTLVAAIERIRFDRGKLFDGAVVVESDPQRSY